MGLWAGMKVGKKNAAVKSSVVAALEGQMFDFGDAGWMVSIMVRTLLGSETEVEDESVVLGSGKEEWICVQMDCRASSSWISRNAMAKAVTDKPTADTPGHGPSRDVWWLGGLAVAAITNLAFPNTT